MRMVSGDAGVEVPGLALYGPTQGGPRCLPPSSPALAALVGKAGCPWDLQAEERQAGFCGADEGWQHCTCAHPDPGDAEGERVP